MDPQQLLAYALDPGRILAAQGIDPDPWQQELLLSRATRILLTCCRGAGKSRVTSTLARHYRQFNENPPDRKQWQEAAAVGSDPASCPLPLLTDAVVPFTPVSEIEKAVARCLASIDFEAIARKTV
jgi:hypothetical protein